jgi:putative ABC transport system ATP-binding protein
MEESVILEARNVTKIFGEGHSAVQALAGVSLKVGTGQLLLIMGPSGSGKTTLLTIMGGLLKPSSGAVLIDGTDITRLSEAQLAPVRREKLGFVFQSFNLWESLSVRENVELPLNMAGVGGRQARATAEQLLRERGLANRMSFRTRDLSGGEKQRVSIARALANYPALLLADEPTANLDSKNGHDVMLLLREIAKGDGRAVVVVSHDQRIREIADRVLWLEDGQMREIGKLVIDPVCGMSFEPGDRPAWRSADVVWHFCSNGCMKEFEEDPGRFVGVPRPDVVDKT